MDLRLSGAEISAWINLMPGDVYSFHISGIAELINAAKTDINEPSLIYMIIYQDDKYRGKLIPKMESADGEVNGNLLPGGLRKFIFTTKQDSDLSKSIDSEKKISLKLFFSDGTSTKDFMIDDITIEKVY